MVLQPKQKRFTIMLDTDPREKRYNMDIYPSKYADRLQMVNVLLHIKDQQPDIYAQACGALGYDPVRVGRESAAYKRQTARKLSQVEQKRRAELPIMEKARDLLERHGEMTSAELSKLIWLSETREHINPRYLGVLLSRMVEMGEIELSPYPWKVRHFGPIGCAFKPDTKR